jgi:hypothetical protein
MTFDCCARAHMPRPVVRSTRRLLAVTLTALLSLPALASPPPTAATAATLSPEQIDAQWLKASAQYAPERQRLVQAARLGRAKAVPLTELV